VAGKHHHDLGVALTELDLARSDLQASTVGSENAEAGCRRSNRESPPTRGSKRLVETVKPQFRFDGRNSGLHERKRRGRYSFIATCDVDDPDDVSGCRIVHRYRCAAPRVHDPSEVFRSSNLDPVIQRKRGAGRARTNPRFRPVGALDEQHSFGFASERPIAVDPEESTGLVADGDDEPGVERVADQKTMDSRQRDREGVSVAVRAQLVVPKIQCGEQPVGVELVSETAPP
jgi:hypothetical protein